MTFRRGGRMHGVLLAFILVTGLVVASAEPARAGSLTFYVDNTVACDDDTANSSVTPYCTIQAAVEDAFNGDIVQVGPGVYQGVFPAVVDLFAEAKSLTIRGAGQGVTIIDGQNARSGIRLFGPATYLIEDLTIDDGSSAGSGGGLALVLDAIVTLNDVSITDSSAAASGAGVYVSADAQLTLNRVTISGSDAVSGGGGIFINSGAMVEIYESVLDTNTAGTDGGGISMHSTGSSLTIEDSEIKNNDAGDEGGGIYVNDSTGTVSITRTEIAGNTALLNGGDGGGIAIDSATQLDLTDSLVYMNESVSGNGGGLAVISFISSGFIGNTTISTNTAALDGGGTWRYDKDFANVTVTGNSAGGDAGGIARGTSAPSVRNSIIANNTAVVDEPDCDLFSAASYSLIGDTTGCSIAVATGNLFNVDPALAPLADNGGPTRTHALTANSPARDAGDPVAPGSGGTACETTDQRGLARDDARCDMGAFEYLPSATVGLVDPGTGQWHLRNSLGVVTSFYFGNPNDVPFMGDWDCDGVDTPGLYRQSDGFAYLRNSNTQGIADIAFFFGNPGDIPIIGDFNNDGCDTVSIYRPSQARFYIINALGEDGGGLGAADYYFDFGNPGDQPFAGDFDGDGFDEVGLHRATTGLVYFEDELIPNSGGGQADHEFFFGNPGDRFVAGDWNTNGSDSPAVFRPGNTTFYFRYTNTQGNADEEFVFGSSTWLPVAGNFEL